MDLGGGGGGEGRGKRKADEGDGKGHKSDDFGKRARTDEAAVEGVPVEGALVADAPGIVVSIGFPDGGGGPKGGVKEDLLPAGGIKDPIGGGLPKVCPRDEGKLKQILGELLLKNHEASPRAQEQHLASLGYSHATIAEAKVHIRNAVNAWLEEKGYPKQVEMLDQGVAVSMADKRGEWDKKKERTGRFTKEEDALLLRAIESALARLHPGKSLEDMKPLMCGPKQRGDARKKDLSEIWEDAFQALPNRSRTSCYDRGRRLLQDTKRGSWSDEELKTIKDMVEKHGTQQWQMIGQEINRPASACKDIWRHRLAKKDSTVPAGRWNEDESRLLVKLVQEAEQGKQAPGGAVSWTDIAAKLKSQRTPDQCRLHWRSVQNGRGHASKEEPQSQAQAQATAQGGKDWVWKRDRWTPEEDAELGRQVKAQVEARGLKDASEIAWAGIDIKTRLPHMAKERFRRRGGECDEGATLLERCEALMSPSVKGKAKARKKTGKAEGEDEDGDKSTAAAGGAPVQVSAAAVPAGGASVGVPPPAPQH